MPLKENNLKRRKPPKVERLPASDTDDNVQSPATDSNIHSAKRKTWCQTCMSVTKYMLLFIIVPPFLNFAALNMESQKLHPPGLTYDVGQGQKMYFNCEGVGSPSVLLDAPTGYSSDMWSLVVAELSKHTKVCVYDRAGIGFSDRPFLNNTQEEGAKAHRWQEFTVERMADDVHRLISYSSQQMQKPFIYVGSELGTLVARFYTQLYEGDVSDLVLIDPLVEGLFDLDEDIWKQYWHSHLIPSAQAMQMAAAAGLTRFGLMLGIASPPMEAAALEQNVTNRQKHLLCNPRHLSTVVDEHYFMQDTFSQMQTVLQLKAFPSNVSVTVITGNYYDEQLPSPLNKAWAKSTQFLLSRLHPSSNHIVVNGADHHMLYRQPRAVIEPIHRIVRRWRQRQDKNDR